jgi:NAD(P)-dependent dehydrogenase (short-subunit alcohol dehydrogenase family)
MSSSLLRDKVAVVTGVSRGIGLAIARAFVSAGAHVLGCSRSGASEKGWRHVQADVGDECGARKVAGIARRHWKRVDILVNNAGVLGPMASLAGYPLSDWDTVLNINVRGPFLMTQSMLPLMSRGASIINVSSGFGIHGRAGAGAYGVSKFAMEGFSHILAEDLLASGIRVNLVDPGAVRTAMRAAVSPGEDPSKLPTPKDIIGVFVFLASDDSRHITGQRFTARSFLT